MPDRSLYEYAILRVVPHVEREEFINAGVIVFCRERRFLAAAIRLDERRLAALAPDLDPAELREQLALVECVAEGRPEGGALSALPPPERFRWLASPRSTMLQVSPVHLGLSESPAAALDDLFRRMVLPTS